MKYPVKFLVYLSMVCYVKIIDVQRQEVVLFEMVISRHFKLVLNKMEWCLYRVRYANVGQEEKRGPVR